jgi:hypothetical protein
MSETSKHLISVAIICLIIISVNHLFCEHGSTFEHIALPSENPQLDTLGMAIFLAGSMRLGLTLGTLFLVKITKSGKADR